MSCSKEIKNGEILGLIAWGRTELMRAGIVEDQEECERILMNLLGCSRSSIYLQEHELSVSGVRERFVMIIEKRVGRIPLAYLLKEADFWQETLLVDERCLIPRPETEILVDQVLKALGEKTKGKASFLDIGTGSGAIAIAILRVCKNFKGTLLDVSREALEVARENLKRYDLEARATQVRGDLFEPFSKNEMWDLIISNPPYLSAGDWENIQEELKFEPKSALDGGKDGFEFYRKIVAEAKNHLIPGGLLALEVGQGQSDMVSKWLHEAGYDNIQCFNDHLRVQRVIMARRHS